MRDVENLLWDFLSLIMAGGEGDGSLASREADRVRSQGRDPHESTIVATDFLFSSGNNGRFLGVTLGYASEGSVSDKS